MKKPNNYYVTFTHTSEVVEFRAKDEKNAIITGKRIADREGKEAFVIAKLKTNNQVNDSTNSLHAKND